MICYKVLKPFFFIFFFLNIYITNAQSPIILTDSTEVIALTLNNINEEDPISFMIIDNSTDKHFLLLSSLHTKDICLIQDKEELNIGLERKFQNRLFRHRQLVFSLKTKHKDTTYFELKNNAKNKTSSTSYNFKIIENRRFINQSLNNYIFYGCFYGFLLYLIVNSLLLGFIESKSIYFYYVAYLLSVVFYLLHHDGLGYQYIWPSYPKFNVIHSPLSFYLLLVGTFVYFINFFTIKENYYNLIKICYVLLVIITIHLVLFLFDIKFQLDFSYVYYTVYAIIFYISLNHTVKHPLLESIFFFTGFSLVLIGWAIYKFHELHLIKLNFFLDNYVYLALEAEALFFSISIVKKIKTLTVKNKSQQKRIIHELEEKKLLSDRVNLELDSKVKKKTEELQKEVDQKLELSQKLEQIGKELDKANLELKYRIKSEQLLRLSDSTMSFHEFLTLFPNNLSCQHYIGELKKQNFECKNCHNHQIKLRVVNKKLFTICTSCRSKKSITSDTIFHNIRHDLNKAFYLVYIEYNTISVTNDSLSNSLDLRLATIWSYRKKVRRTIQQLKPNKWEELLLSKIQ